MDKNELLKEKRKELTRLLENWAMDNGILNVGEFLVFSLRIEKHQVVVHLSDSEKYLDMSVESFFTKERLMSGSMSKFQATMVSNAIKAQNKKQGSDKNEVIFKSVREFLEVYNSVDNMRNIRNMGWPTARNLVKTLQNLGIELNGYD